ncbi:thiamine pyrophosphate-binding protein [Asanoa sp. WMMD1127]|uniref:thiamine pyrophosphate-binding protein n=1 Tax=Asanoa sp. WMMD1127 TaxID=3016107 RepID=UPI0024163CA7|nr:thiamine pyrophosphate-binding protein [Asanoa sp. WMMD1127]MDG4825284.1 thiamine pyrophosphate-binding protein [Asanoa sp. WMMD1127]
MTGFTGGDAVVEALRALGVDRVFVVASVHNLPILNALHRDGGIAVVNVRHEQAAVHGADGYARVTGRLGVAITSTGPGAANAMGGLFEAGFASSPVLMLTGQVETGFYGKGRGYLHEAERQLEMLRSVTRQAWSVRRAADIAEVVVAAGREALTGRPQPTAVEIPVDLQYAETPRTGVVAAPVPRAAPDPARVAAAAALLAGARRPLVWAGGGVNHAGAADALRAFVERLGIPVVTSTEGRGALPEDHPLCLGSLATYKPLRAHVERADAVLVVGSRFQMYPTGFWRLRLPPALVHLDADPTVIGRSYPARVALVADARDGLAALDAALPTGAVEPGWADEGRAAADATVARARERLGPDHRGIMDAIRRHLPRDGVVVRDSTVPAYVWGDSLLPILSSRTSLRPVSSAIGPGLPLAIGAAAGAGERTVVIHGDGGIMLTIGELSTLAQTGLPVTVCVFNDRGYGILRGIEAATFAGAQHDVDLATPDFAALAEAMGVPAEKVSDAAGFEKAFAASVARPGPALIEVDLLALAPMDYPIGGHENVA